MLLFEAHVGDQGRLRFVCIEDRKAVDIKQMEVGAGPVLDGPSLRFFKCYCFKDTGVIQRSIKRKG